MANGSNDRGALAENLRAEAEGKYAGTQAWREYERRTEHRSEAQNAASAERLMDVFCEFGRILETDPKGERAQRLAAKLRQVITEEYYNCTPCILSGLGKTYAEDERMRRSIDEAAGEGTALFASRAIAAYCARSDT